jgi:crossover junction endodeoxyribonuclease RuvC
MAEIILGLDPGTATTGFGVVSVEGGRLAHLGHGCITTPKSLSAAERLVMIVQKLKVILDTYQPTSVAIEEIFFTNNVTTAISVAQARGAMIATVADRDLRVAGYTPLQVKQAVTGDGRADKLQIQKMVTMILGLAEVPSPDDAADAIAIAIAHAHSYKLNSLIR